MDNKIYDLGIVCGRFGHEHIGHIALFNSCLALCKQTLILVGSAQESGTLRNPFKIETRIEVIRKTYPTKREDTIMVRGINDLTNEYDLTTDWGKFVKSEVIRHKHKFADLMVYGKDEERNTWFEQKDIEKTAELIVPREMIPISSTKIRGMLVINDKNNWKKFTSPNIYDMYEKLRDEIMSVSIYKDIYDKIDANHMCLEDFMKIYTELEKIDKKSKIAKL